MIRWSPIETAPREDGVRLLLRFHIPTEQFAVDVVGYWSDAHGKPGDWYTPAGWYAKALNDPADFDCNPLHPVAWRPYFGPDPEWIWRKRGWRKEGEPPGFLCGATMHTDWTFGWARVPAEWLEFAKPGEPREWREHG